MWGFGEQIPRLRTWLWPHAAEPTLRIIHLYHIARDGDWLLTGQMASTDQRGVRANALLALVAGVLIFGALVVAARELRLDSPASPHARTLLRLDSTLGATLEPLDARAARTLGGGSQVDEMVVTSIAAGGRASAAGLHVGDVVEQVDGKDPQDLEAAIDAIAIDPTSILVNRHGSRVMLNVPAPGATSHT